MVKLGKKRGVGSGQLATSSLETNSFGQRFSIFLFRQRLIRCYNQMNEVIKPCKLTSTNTIT